MDLYRLLVSVLLWKFFVVAEFFLEVVKPSADATGLVENMINRGTKKKIEQALRPEGKDEPFSVHLYACNYDTGIHLVASAWCTEILDREKKQEVYEVQNFNGVFDLELSPFCQLKKEGIYSSGNLPEVLTVATPPQNVISMVLKPTTADQEIIKNKVQTFLGPFNKHEANYRVGGLIQFFAMNTIVSFYGWKEFSRLWFESYVAVLQKLINASGYNPDLGKLNLLVATLFQCRFRPQSPHKSQSRSWSLPQMFTAHRAKVTPQPQSKSNPVSKSDILVAAGFLSFKMFDPCSIERMEFLQPGDAGKYCKIYCQFLSITMRLYDEKVSKQCKNLKTGRCENAMCVCGLKREDAKGNVNMVFCNNALRVHIYQLNGLDV